MTLGVEGEDPYPHLLSLARWAAIGYPAFRHHCGALIDRVNHETQADRQDRLRLQCPQCRELVGPHDLGLSSGGHAAPVPLRKVPPCTVVRLPDGRTVVNGDPVPALKRAGVAVISYPRPGDSGLGHEELPDTTLVEVLQEGFALAHTWLAERPWLWSPAPPAAD